MVIDRANKGRRVGTARSLAGAVLRSRTWRAIEAATIGARFGRFAGIAHFYGTDKWSPRHRYAPHYQTHLRRRRVRRILEIGIGGDQDPAEGGASLRTWRKLLPLATIVGLDLHAKHVSGRRIVVYQGDQSDPLLLDRIGREQGPFDVIVDDGSHVNEHVLASIKHLWRHLAPGGLYIIEDMETAYYESYGGGLPGASATSVDLLKGLLDSVNRSYFDSSQQASAIHSEVTAVHAYECIAFIEKQGSLTASRVVRPI